MTTLAVRRIKVAVEGSEPAGLLILRDDALVAVLVCLDEAIYGKEEGRWYLEAGFGRCAAPASTFKNLGAALRWIAGRLDLPEESVMPGIEGFSTGS